MNVFSDEMSKVTLDAVPESHCTINDEYDEVHTNPFAGIALWKIVTTRSIFEEFVHMSTLLNTVCDR